MRLYFQQFNVKLFQEWRFPLVQKHFGDFQITANLCDTSPFTLQHTCKEIHLLKMSFSFLVHTSSAGPC